MTESTLLKGAQKYRGFDDVVVRKTHRFLISPAAIELLSWLQLIIDYLSQITGAAMRQLSSSRKSYSIFACSLLQLSSIHRFSKPLPVYPLLIVWDGKGPLRLSLAQQAQGRDSDDGR